MSVKVAVIQESPVFFDKEVTLQKTEQLVREYAKQDCQLLVFPESLYRAIHVGSASEP